MRIGIDVRATGGHFPGIRRATLGLLAGLQSLPDSFSLDLIANPTTPTTQERQQIDDPRFRWHDAASGPFSPGQQWLLPPLAHRLSLDLWHAPYYIRPFWGLPRPVVTVYDVIGQVVPGALSPRARLIFALTLRLSLRTANLVITSSRATANDLKRLHRVPDHKLAIIPLAADNHFLPSSITNLNRIRTHYGLPERYVMYLGSNKPHKQPAVAVKAFKQAIERDRALRDLHLVVAGHWDPRFPAARQAAGSEERVHFLHDLAEADLPAVLGGAEVFLFPSLYEGFGLPALEAMACGVPVVVANRASLPEVVGDAGLVVEPTAAAFADALAMLLGDAALRTRLRDQGLAQAAKFSWSATAAATLAAYQRVCYSFDA